MVDDYSVGFVAGAESHAAKTQAFFANLAASVIPPHTGDDYRKMVTELLKRAIEAGIYSEPK